MFSLIKQRTISEIIASRNDKRIQKKIKNNLVANSFTNIETTSQSKADYLLKKTAYTNQDKLLLLRYIERKYRLLFDQSINFTMLNLINIKQNTIIQKNYDCNKKSYFIIRGKITILQKGFSLRQTNRSEKYVQVASFEGEAGIGKVFNDDQYTKALVKCQNAIVLEIVHDKNEHLSIERNCLMTFDQKEVFVKQLSLFKNLDNVNRYYIPFFRSRRVNKGQLIYSIGQRSEFLYLIVDGQVQFQSKLNLQFLQPIDTSAITQLILKNQFQNYILITTEILSTSNYFGEEQILINANRKQNAKCLSLSCLLIEIPLEKVNKLLFYNQFREVLQSTAKQKENQRQKKINNFIQFRCVKKQSSASSQRKKDNPMTFEELNEGIYHHGSPKKGKDLKISLYDKNTKIVHGNSVKRTDLKHTRMKTQDFSMLKVNQSTFQSSMKKYRAFSVFQKKYESSKIKNKVKDEKQGRTLFKMWKILNLHNILQEDQKLNLQKEEGMQFYKTHMRMMKHLSDVKSYRPKTISSNCRIKIQYIDYLQNIL